MDNILYTFNMDRLKRVVIVALDSLIISAFLSKFLFCRDIANIQFYGGIRFVVVAFGIFLALSLVQYHYPCEDKRAEWKFLLISLLFLILLFILQLLSLDFLQFQIFDLRWLLTSWQIEIVATSFFIGIFVSMYLTNYKKEQKINLIWPALIFVFSSTVYVLMSLRNHSTFGTPARDLGIFDQAIWNLSKLHAPASTIRGYANLWGDHWHPILAVFAPLYWIWDNVRAVLIAQALIVSGGVFAVYLLVMKILKSNLLAVALAFTYVFYGGIQHAINFGFYPENIAPALILASIAALYWKKIYLYFMFFFLAILTKENIALYFVAFSFILFFASDKKKVAVITFFLSCAYFLASYKLILPYFSGSDSYQYASLYSGLGDTPSEIIKEIVARPLYVIQMLFNPTIKLDTITTILASVLFLPLYSVWGLLLIPNIFENFLANRFLQWPFGYHYQAGIIAFAIFASIMSLSSLTLKFDKIWQNRLKFAFGLATLLTLIFLNFTYKLPVTNLLTYKIQDFFQNKEVTLVLSLIPEEATVSAQNTLAPHLSHRRTIYHFPDINESEYVVLSSVLSAFPFSEQEILVKIKELKLNPDWEVVAENKTIVLFRRR